MGRSQGTGICKQCDKPSVDYQFGYCIDHWPHALLCGCDYCAAGG